MPNQPLEALKRLTGPRLDPSQQILPQEQAPVQDPMMEQGMPMGMPPEMPLGPAPGGLAGPPDQTAEAGRQILTKALAALMGILGPVGGMGMEDPEAMMPLPGMNGMGPGGPMGPMGA